MEAVLARIKQCREVSTMCDNGISSSSDPVPSLLLLYQLEAQLHLGIMNSSNELMDMISSLPQVEPKLYETVAGQNLELTLCSSYYILQLMGREVHDGWDGGRCMGEGGRCMGGMVGGGGRGR